MAVNKRPYTKSKSSWLTRVTLHWLCIAFLGWLVLFGWALTSWVNQGFIPTLVEVRHRTLQQSFSVRNLNESVLLKQLSAYVATQILPQSQQLMHKAQGTGALLSLKAKEQVNHLIPGEGIPGAAQLSEHIMRVGEKAQQCFLLLEATGQLLLVKLTLLLAAIPLFLFAIAAGLVDGLNQRAIRTASLGRESTYVFHKSIPFARKALFWILGLWLALPQVFSPSQLFIGLSVLLCFVVSVSASRFKKYL